jgi:hypothetical protein
MNRIRYNKWLGRRLWHMQKKLDEMSAKLSTMELSRRLEQEARNRAAMNRLTDRVPKTRKRPIPFAPVTFGGYPWKPDKPKP